MKLLFSTTSKRPFGTIFQNYFVLAWLLLLLPRLTTVHAQDQTRSNLPADSSATISTSIATNKTPFVASRYSNVQVRHVPAPEPPAELLQAALAGRRNPGVKLKGTTAKGGTLIRVDETYQVPELAPPLKASNESKSQTNSPVAIQNSIGSKKVSDQPSRNQN